MKKANNDISNNKLYYILYKQFLNIKDQLLDSNCNHKSIDLAINQNIAIIDKKISEMEDDLSKNNEYLNNYNKIKLDSNFADVASGGIVITTVILIFNMLLIVGIGWLLGFAHWSETAQVFGILGGVVTLLGLSLTEGIALIKSLQKEEICQKYGISEKEYKLGKEKSLEAELLKQFKDLRIKFKEVLDKNSNNVEKENKVKLDIYFAQISEALKKLEELKDKTKRQNYKAKLLALNEYYEKELLKIKSNNVSYTESERKLNTFLIKSIAEIEFSIEQEIRQEKQINKIVNDADFVKNQGTATATLEEDKTFRSR